MEGRGEACETSFTPPISIHLLHAYTFCMHTLLRDRADNDLPNPHIERFTQVGETGTKGLKGQGHP